MKTLRYGLLAAILAVAAIALVQARKHTWQPTIQKVEHEETIQFIHDTCDRFLAQDRSNDNPGKQGSLDVLVMMCNYINQLEWYAVKCGKESEPEAQKGKKVNYAFQTRSKI